jgi:hypothetical protein
LSNRSAGVAKGRERTRVEEKSGVQKKGERCGRCGEMRTGMGCGDGPARKGEGASLVVLLLAERARLNCARSMRAVKDSLVTSPEEMIKDPRYVEREGPNARR